MGAGRTKDASLLPVVGKTVIDPLPVRETSGGGTYFEAIDLALNTQIDIVGPVKPVIRSLSPTGLICAEQAAPATAQIDQIRLLSERPLSSYITLRSIVSKSGDLACCYGHALNKDDKPVGYYMRLWRLEQAGKVPPRLVVDNFLKAT